jgi:carbamoyl-phosphate synthase large subunit
MKSVGEVMAIGRSFIESFQKALRSLEGNLSGLDEIAIASQDPEIRVKIIKEKLKIAAPNRLLLIAQAMREGISCKEINQITSYDPWFLEQIYSVILVEAKVRKEGLPKNREDFLNLKRMGFADKRLAKITGQTEKEVRELRCALNLNPSYKRVDSCAAEFDSVTSYMYSTYEE